MHSILDTESLRCLFAIQVETLGRQLEFGAEVGYCQCTCGIGKLQDFQGVSVHIDMLVEDVLGQCLMVRQCLEVGEIGKSHKEN